jgi:hypothetical protein
VDEGKKWSAALSSVGVKQTVTDREIEEDELGYDASQWLS